MLITDLNWSVYKDNTPSFCNLTEIRKTTKQEWESMNVKKKCRVDISNMNGKTKRMFYYKKFLSQKNQNRVVMKKITR